VVRLLLEKGAELDSKHARFGGTSLSLAAGSGHEAVVKLLLEKGAEFEPKDNEGHTPLSHAAMNGHKAMVKLLLEKAAELESKDGTCWTPLSCPNSNLDFSRLENSDVLENFDFDSFINTSNEDAFNFDNTMGIGGTIISKRRGGYSTVVPESGQQS